MRRSFRIAGLLLVTVTAGCVSKISVASLIPSDCHVGSGRFDSLVQVRTDRLGRAVDSMGLVDEFLLEDAIVEALNRARMFRGIGTAKTADYALLVKMGIRNSFTGTRIEAIGEWVLEDLKTGERKYQETIYAEGKASFGEAWIAAKRGRLAMERAIEKNICEGLIGLSRIEPPV